MTKQDQLQYFQISRTCPFEKCGIKSLENKKWASVEDAGILLCTKAPELVDCLKYNTEYRKVLSLKEDLQEEDGIFVDFWEMNEKEKQSKCI